MNSSNYDDLTIRSEMPEVQQLLPERLNPTEVARRLFNLGFRLSNPIDTQLTDTNEDITLSNVHLPYFNAYYADGTNRNTGEVYDYLGLPDGEWENGEGGMFDATDVLDELYRMSAEVVSNRRARLSAELTASLDGSTRYAIIDWVSSPETRKVWGEFKCLNSLLILNSDNLHEIPDDMLATVVAQIDASTRKALTNEGQHYYIELIPDASLIENYLELPQLARAIAKYLLCGHSNARRSRRAIDKTTFFQSLRGLSESEIIQQLIETSFIEQGDTASVFVHYLLAFDQRYPDALHDIGNELLDELSQRGQSIESYSSALDSFFTRLFLGNEFISKLYMEVVYPDRLERYFTWKNCTEKMMGIELHLQSNGNLIVPGTNEVIRPPLPVFNSEYGAEFLTPANLADAITIAENRAEAVLRNYEALMVKVGELKQLENDVANSQTPKSQ